MIKIYNEVIEPDREPDFTWRDNTISYYYSFWFDESIGKYVSIMDEQTELYYECFYLKRIEEKIGPRYYYKTKEFGWTSLTGGLSTSYANEVIREIEQGRNRWLATKALEEEIR